MSNATQNSREPGDNQRRRRSRGGQNRRNNNNQQDRRGGQHESNPNRGGQNRRSEEFRPQAPRAPYKHQPVKLSWWQKLLKAIGLYKEPAPPARQPRQEKSEPREPKSNTRNARSEDSQNREKRGDSPRSDGSKRGERGERRERSPRGGNPDSVESARVYVGNLSYDVTEQDLQELFKGVGPVRNVEIVYNRSTHRSKGYGFVEMLHVDEARRAVEILHDQHFMGRQMTVSGAKSKGQDDREDQEERQQAPARPVVVAPLAPAAETASPIEEPAQPEIASTDLVAPVIEEVSATEEKSEVA